MAEGGYSNIVLENLITPPKKQGKVPETGTGSSKKKAPETGAIFKNRDTRFSRTKTSENHSETTEGAAGSVFKPNQSQRKSHQEDALTP